MSDNRITKPVAFLPELFGAKARKAKATKEPRWTDCSVCRKSFKNINRHNCKGEN